MHSAHVVGRLGALGLSLALLLSATGLGSPAQDPEPTTTPADEAPAASLVGHTTTRLYHRPDCKAVQKLSGKARVALASPDEAVAQGYAPCRVCKPDAATKPGAAGGSPRTPKASAKARRKPGAKGADRPAAGPDGSMPAAPRTTPPGGDGTLKFSRDIAPILAGNCLGCHNADRKQGMLDFSTFEKLLAGNDAGPVIVPGQPEQSRLIEQVVSRKMPRGGGNRRLSDEAIGRLQTWVKQGALLDAGPNISPTAPIDKIAPTAEQRKAEELAKLSPEQREARLEETARERFKQAGRSEPPRLVSGRAVALFSELPQERARALVQTLDEQRERVLALLGPETAGSLAGPLKLSLYVFPDANTYAEFVRSVERRELEAGAQAHGRLTVDVPYLAAIDPLAGGPEPEASPTTARRGSRSKKATPREPLASGPERSLAGLLTEALGQAAISAGGKAPRWLAEGLGAFLGAGVEPRSAYYARLRQTAGEQYQLGWQARATEALGDQGSPEALRAIGLSFFDWLSASPDLRAGLPPLVRGLAEQGGARIDELVSQQYAGTTRDQLLATWGQFVASRSGSGRRR